MKYTFWDNLEGYCLIEREEDGHFYVTDMIDWYTKDEGRKALLPFTKQWGTDSPDCFDTNKCRYLGELEISEATMSTDDREVLQRCIDKEGFDYAMFHYSDYQSVDFNVVNDRGFHKRLNDLKDAYNELKIYLKLQGVELQ